MTSYIYSLKSVLQQYLLLIFEKFIIVILLTRIIVYYKFMFMYEFHRRYFIM